MKQISLAILNFESTYKKLPPGAFLGEGSAWSAFILPFLEEGAVFSHLTIGEDDNGNYQWGYNGGEYDSVESLGDKFRNMLLVETVMDVYRCPSMALPEHVYDLSADSYLVMRRVPGSYIGVASGLAQAQFPSFWLRIRKHPPQQPLWEGADGVMVGIHHQDDVGFGQIPLRKVLDGTSKTVMVGEAVSDVVTIEDRSGQAEDRRGDRKDHWYGGSDDIDTSISTDSYSDISEFLGSTGVGINLQGDPEDNQRICRTGDSFQCQALQLCFSSEHAGLVQMAFVDGHVDGIQESVDPVVWSDMGTRSGQFYTTGGADRR